MSTMKIVENGPFVVSGLKSSEIAIQSDDFHHDASLAISGDFESSDQKRAYANEIARRLNAQLPTRDLTMGEAIDLLHREHGAILRSKCRKYELLVSSAKTDAFAIVLHSPGSGFKQRLPFPKDVWSSITWECPRQSGASQ